MASNLPLLLLLFAFAAAFRCSFAESIRKELRDKEADRDSIIQLDRSVQINRLDPSKVVQISWRPRGFLSDEECDRLISLEQGGKAASLGNGNYSRRVTMKRLLASSETPDDVVARIEERISAWTFLPKENSRPLKVMRYGHEDGKENFDYFGNKSTMGLSGPLLATVVLYLSNVTKGGDILFPELEPKSKIWSDCTKTSNILKPGKGNAILFFTVRPNASPDTSSSHARCPVLEGEMWCATKFFHVRAIQREKSSFDSDGSECIDEDESCPRWAAIGECERNPVYMVGSADYYGTCRQSCNAC